jgi:serine/threonine-protein kinase HipA
MNEPGRWSLSPAYDLNPVPEIDQTSVPKTPISEDSNEVSIAAAMKAGDRFGLKQADRKTILDEVFMAVSDWRKTAKTLRIKAPTIDAYSTAFEHPFMTEARKLLIKQ